MDAIANHALRDLNEQSVRVDVQYSGKLPGVPHFPLEDSGLYAQAFTGHLCVGPAERGLRTEKERQSDHSFVSHRRDFNGPAILCDRDEGDHASEREIQMLNWTAGLVR
jgi:hypothetical protein